MNKIQQNMNYNALTRLLEFNITSCEYCRKLINPWYYGYTLTGNFFRLYWNDGNEAGVIINGRKHHMSRENFYLLPPNCNLSTFCNSGSEKQLFVHFQLAKYRCTSLLTAIPASEDLMSTVGKLIAAFEAPDEHADSERLFLATAWCGGVLSRLPDGTLTTLPVDLSVERACAIMAESPGEAPDISTLAGTVNLSTAEFSRRFKAATGMPPYAYLSNMRYEIAASMLADGSGSIDEICEVIGIRDRFHFSREFKRRYGLPPAAYRRMMLGSAPPKKP